MRCRRFFLPQRGREKGQDETDIAAKGGIGRLRRGIEENVKLTEQH